LTGSFRIEEIIFGKAQTIKPFRQLRIFWFEIINTKLVVSIMKGRNFMPTILKIS
jgi:hypothetical protein